MSKRFSIAFVLGVIFCGHSWAAAVVQSIYGEVRAEAAGKSSALVANERIDAGTTIETGNNGQVVLRFDDGQVTALSANSSFRIDQYRFDAAKPEDGNIALSLLKGALRAVTGLIGKRNPSRFALATPNATIGIRGTDFMVAIVNPVYVSVSEGAISTANAAGTVNFSAGATGMVASSTTLATSIAASALPAGVGAAFGELGSLSIAGGAGVVGAGGASQAVSAAAGGLSGGAIAAGALAVGAVAAGTSNSSSSNSSTTTTTAN